MEEIQLFFLWQGKEGQENGYIIIKFVRVFSFLYGDDQDSEDEVLIILEVKVYLGRGVGVESFYLVRNLQSSVFQECEDDRVGLVRGEKVRKGKFRFVQQKIVSFIKLVFFYDDSDEDFLYI